MGAIGRMGRVLISVTLASTAVVGIAYATIPDAGGSFHGCVRAGNLRLIDTDRGESCRNNETAVSWSRGGGAVGCEDVTDTIAGTWAVTNYARGEVGQVTFNADGSYTIDSG